MLVSLYKQACTKAFLHRVHCEYTDTNLSWQIIVTLQPQNVFMTASYKQTFHTMRCEKLQYSSALACCIIWTEELFKTLQGHSWAMYKAITFCLFILWQEAYHMKGMKICLVDKWLSLHVIIFFLWPCTLLVSLIFQSRRRTYHFPLVLNLLHIQYNVLCVLY